MLATKGAWLLSVAGCGQKDAPLKDKQKKNNLSPQPSDSTLLLEEVLVGVANSNHSN